MNFISSMLVGTGKATGKAAIGSVPKRMLLGAELGAAYTAATTDQQETTNYLSSLAKGALTGGLLGGASRLVTPALVGGQIRKPLGMTGKGIKNIANAGYKTAKLGLRGTFNTANFALRHPYMAAGIIGGGYALMNQISEPIYSSDIYSAKSYQSSGSNRQLMQSTEGLVSGMWQSRHG
jgi:hypothetical protein